MRQIALVLLVAACSPTPDATCGEGLVLDANGVCQAPDDAGGVPGGGVGGTGGSGGGGGGLASVEVGEVAAFSLHADLFWDADRGELIVASLSGEGTYASLTLVLHDDAGRELCEIWQPIAGAPDEGGWAADAGLAPAFTSSLTDVVSTCDGQPVGELADPDVLAQLELGAAIVPDFDGMWGIGLWHGGPDAGFDVVPALAWTLVDGEVIGDPLPYDGHEVAPTALYETLNDSVEPIDALVRVEQPGGTGTGTGTGTETGTGTGTGTGGGGTGTTSGDPAGGATNFFVTGSFTWDPRVNASFPVEADGEPVDHTAVLSMIDGAGAPVCDVWLSRTGALPTHIPAWIDAHGQAAGLEFDGGDISFNGCEHLGGIYDDADFLDGLTFGLSVGPHFEPDADPELLPTYADDLIGMNAFVRDTAGDELLLAGLGMAFAVEGDQLLLDGDYLIPLDGDDVIEDPARAYYRIVAPIYMLDIEVLF